MSLVVHVERGGAGPARVYLTGTIDERAPIQQILGEIKEDVVLNLSRIERVNSVGLLQWLKHIGPLTRTYRVEVEAISYGLSLQANQLTDLFGKAHVRSCLAPYFCPVCKTNRQVEVTAAEVAALTSGAPDKPCPECQSSMDFDDLDDFFSFLRSDYAA
jgi:hypothetical protein